MKWFYNLGLFRKLILSFLLVAIILMIQGWLALRQIDLLGGLSEDIYQKNLLTLNRINSLQRSVSEYRLALFQLIGEDDPDKMEQHITILDQKNNTIQAGVNSQQLQSVRENLQKFQRKWAALLAHTTEIIQLAENYAKDDAFELANQENKQLYEQSVLVIAELTTSLEKDAEANYQNSRAIIQGNLFSTISFILIGVAVALLLAFLLGKMITRPLLELSRCVIEVEKDKDLSLRVKVSSSDEIGQTALAFNELMESLQGMINQINQNSETLSAASVELSTTTTDLERNSTLVITGLETSNSAIHQSTVNIKDSVQSMEQISGHINEIQVKAKAAEEDAKLGTEAVQSTKDSIHKIAESAKEIQMVMAVITEIANQTNLLSLNAAIEAAKAGDSGKGFAVVAEEVRILADRSASSVIKTQQLIEESTANVDEGTQVIQKAGEVLVNIIRQVSEISAGIHEVAEKMMEQKQRTQEMSGTADEISEISSSNADSMKELSEATKQVDITADDLAQMADHLREQMAMFKT